MEYHSPGDPMGSLVYTLHDPARWSKRFGLLKRVYTIDSWDFAVEDEYTPDLGITNTMVTSVLERTRDIGIMKAVGASSACRAGH
jgi:hypothetical protein